MFCCRGARQICPRDLPGFIYECAYFARIVCSYKLCGQEERPRQPRIERNRGKGAAEWCRHALIERAERCQCGGGRIQSGLGRRI
jgi:hypothetical protein